jgi:hypothetical protein
VKEFINDLRQVGGFLQATIKLTTNLENGEPRIPLLFTVSFRVLTIYFIILNNHQRFL